MMGSIVSFSLLAVSGREAAAELDTFEIMTYRSFIGVAIVCVLAWWRGQLATIQATRWRLHGLRNVSHFTGQNLWLYAVATIPLAQVFAFEFTTPLWVALLAPLLLGERFTRLRVATTLLGFVGILLVARPGLTPWSVGMMAAMISAVGFAGSAIFTKQLTQHESVVSILFWLCVLQALFGLVCAGYDGRMTWPSAAMWPWVVLVSVAGLAAHFCLTQALSLAAATVVMPLDFMRLPLIAGIGALAYGEALDSWIFVGAVVIFSANYINVRASARG
jgi:drug/metabolite transporter (DMT)-like permease